MMVLDNKETNKQRNKGESNMSRIDVSFDKYEKGYKVLVNFCQRFITFHSAILANQKATELHAQIPNAELHLFVEA